MKITPITILPPASSLTGRFAFGDASFGAEHPLVRESWGNSGRTSGERQFLDHAIVGQITLAALNRYEDLGVLLNDPDLVFEIMELKERLGLPLSR